MFASNNAVKIHYELMGEGEPLVLQHGTAGSIELWHELGYTKVLAKHFQLILIDARGHGQSDKPHEPSAYSLEKRAKDVISVLDHMGLDHAIYFGYSMGGWIGYGLAARFQHRFSAFVLGGSQPYASGTLVESLGPVLDQGMQAFIELGEKHQVPISPEYRRRLLASDSLALKAAVTEPRPDLSDILPGIKKPTLLYAGDQDPIYSQVCSAANIIPNAILKILPGRNHNDVFYECQRTVLSFVLDFLTS